ncbi:MAG: phage tail sheath subtilisin-like domain-containing protein [Bryobacteraceae bacterium]
MAYNIGLNVVEVDGQGAPAIAGAAVSVAGFNILTRRGIPNRPARVTSFAQFVDQFGGFFAGGYGAYMVKGFFDNGGRTAYINRVVSTDAQQGAGPATASLSDSANQATLTLNGGYRGTSDPGSWGNDLYIKAEPVDGLSVGLDETNPAAITGTALAAQVDMSTLPKLTVFVDGETTGTDVNFQATDFADATKATPVEIRDAINKNTSKFTAQATNDRKLVLTSNGAIARIQRTFTSLEIKTANPTLGLAVGKATGTAAALNATSTTLSSAEAFAPGEAISIDDGAGHKATATVVRANPDSGAIEWTPAVANPGNFAGATTKVTKLEVNLTVAYGGTEQDKIVETYKGLSSGKNAPNYIVSMLNDTTSGSKYVKAADGNSNSAPGANRPQTNGFARFTPGKDGTPTPLDFVGDSSKSTGFSAFDAAEIQLLTCERTDPLIVASALGYCANRGDCMYVGFVPFGSVGARQAVAYGQSFQGKKVYGALYGPWIQVVDPLAAGSNPLKFVPPSGHVMGVYARVESTRGIWKAPAGDEANVVGAIDIEYQLSDADHTNLVIDGSVNGIRAVAGAGIVVDASRTLSTDTRWLYVNVRLLFNYVKSSLRAGLRWVRQEPNRDTLWNIVKLNSVTPFLLGLWRQGAFGTGKPEQVFTVICDASNNPPDQVDLGMFKVEVYFYPSKPAETIVIIVGQQPSGASASEA